MKKFLKISAAAMVLWLLAATTAEACYCGAMRRRTCCQTCCATPCEYQTVMKTCTRVVYETEQYTAYRTCCEPVYEQKIVEAVRYVPETKYRSACKRSAGRSIKPR